MICHMIIYCRKVIRWCSQVRVATGRPYIPACVQKIKQPDINHLRKLSITATFYQRCSQIQASVKSGRHAPESETQPPAAEPPLTIDNTPSSDIISASSRTSELTDSSVKHSGQVDLHFHAQMR